MRPQFELFDTDHDHWINYEEFRFVLRALGFELPKSQTYDLLVKHGIKPPEWGQQQQQQQQQRHSGGGVHRLNSGGGTGADGDGDCPPIYRQFNLATVQAIAGGMLARRDPRDEARRAYRLFDQDNKGIITKDDLARVCAAIGNNMAEAEMDMMIDEFDSNGKGGVNETEFVRLMMSRR